MNKFEIVRHGNQITNQMKDDLVHYFYESLSDDAYKQSKQADTIKSDMEQKYRFRWNILTHDIHVEISSSYVYAEEFLIEIKFEKLVLQAYLVPDQPVINYDPREDRWNGTCIGSILQYSDQAIQVPSYLLSMKYHLFMNKLTTTLFKFSVSEELLLSLSMAHQNYKTTTQSELADHFYNNKLINTNLKQHFINLDRKYFQGDQQLTPDVLYGNFPIKLNKFDNMTTPIMHVIPSNHIYEHAIQAITQVSILDIGTGRGYIPYLLQLALPNANILGVDINPRLILQCQQLKESLQHLFKDSKHPQFQQHNIFQQDQTQIFDYINVGFALRDSDIDQLLKQVRQFLICPLITDSEQWLTKIDKTGQSQKIMKCMFQQGLKQQRSGPMALDTLKEKETQLESYIKQWQKDYVNIHNSKPTLEAMRQDPVLQDCLKQLKQTKLDIRRV